MQYRTRRTRGCATVLLRIKYPVPALSCKKPAQSAQSAHDYAFFAGFLGRFVGRFSPFQPEIGPRNRPIFRVNRVRGPIGPILGGREKNWLAVSYGRPRGPFEAGCVSFRTRLHPRVRRVHPSFLSCRTRRTRKCATVLPKTEERVFADQALSCTESVQSDYSDRYGTFSPGFRARFVGRFSPTMAQNGPGNRPIAPRIDTYGPICPIFGKREVWPAMIARLRPALRRHWARHPRSAANSRPAPCEAVRSCRRRY